MQQRFSVACIQRCSNAGTSSEESLQEVKGSNQRGKELDLETADVVAHEMESEWRLKKALNDYTHWFQPLTGVTAEKHDAFITELRWRTVKC